MQGILKYKGTFVQSFFRYLLNLYCLRKTCGSIDLAVSAPRPHVFGRVLLLGVFTCFHLTVRSLRSSLQELLDLNDVNSCVISVRG